MLILDELLLIDVLMNHVHSILHKNKTNQINKWNSCFVLFTSISEEFVFDNERSFNNSLCAAAAICSAWSLTSLASFISWSNCSIFAFNCVISLERFCSIFESFWFSWRICCWRRSRSFLNAPNSFSVFNWISFVIWSLWDNSELCSFIRVFNSKRTFVNSALVCSNWLPNCDNANLYGPSTSEDSRSRIWSILLLSSN